MIARFGPYELDLDRIEIRVDGENVAAEPQTFSVLAYLLAHRDRVVSKEELLDEVWDDRFVSESALTSRIKSARKAVGDDGRTQSVIQTAHGRGYRFVAEVELVDSDGSSSRPSEPSSGPEPDDPWPLVGRHRLLDQFESLLGAPESGGVVVTGPAGIGKTRLAQAGLDRARHLGWHVEQIRASSSGRYVPLSGVAHLIPADLVDEDGSDGELARAMAFARARAALESIGAGQRFALLVDDADQLDDLSRALVAALIGSNSVFAILTQRRSSEEPVTFAEFVGSGHLSHYELDPLDDTDLDVLLYRVLEGPIDMASLEELTALSDGRPGALRQVVQSCLHTGSLALVDEVWRLVGPVQIDGLPSGSGPPLLPDLGASARAGAELLALAHELDLDVATELIGSDALDELDQADLLALGSGPDGPRLSLARNHVAHLLEEGLGQLRARRHKRRLVAALSGSGATPDDRLRVVRWSVETGESPPSSDVVAAARLAIECDEDATAEILLAHLDRSAPGSDALGLRGELRFQQGRSADAARAFDAIDLTEVEESEAAAVIRRRAAIAFHLDGGQREAITVMDAHPVLTWSNAALAAQWVVFQSMLGEVDEVLARADDLLARGPVTHELRLGVAEALRLHGRPDRALELLAAPLDAQIDGAAEVVADETDLAVQIDSHLTRGDLAGALGLIGRHLPAGRRATSPALPLAAARAHILAGRPRAAAALLAAPTAQRRGPIASHVGPLRAATLAQVHARLGDHQVALRRAQEALVGIDDLVGQLKWSLALALAEAWSDLGRIDDALALVLAQVDDAATAGAVVTEAELLALAANTGRAHHAVARLDRVAAAIEGPLWPIRVREAHARAAGSEESEMAEIAAAYRRLGADGLAERGERSVGVDAANHR